METEHLRKFQVDMILGLSKVYSIFRNEQKLEPQVQMQLSLKIKTLTEEEI